MGTTQVNARDYLLAIAQASHPKRVMRSLRGAFGHFTSIG
jgi:hypothetical protein